MLFLNFLDNSICEIYYDYSQNQDNPVTHVVLGQEQTSAGDHFNNNTIKYLLEILGQVEAKDRNFNLVNTVCEYFTNNI